MVRGLDGIRLEDLVTWGRSTWMDLSEWTQNVNIFLSHENANQKATTSEETLNNK